MLNFVLETFLLGLKNLRLHKLRSLLTALGIIFGVAAVIIMVAIGEGTKRSALEQIEQLGATNVLVRSMRPPESTEASGRSQRTLIYGLTRDDLKRLQKSSSAATSVPRRPTPSAPRRTSSASSTCGYPRAGSSTPSSTSGARPSA
jgi:putative ABC transport system permease protein